MKNAVKPLILAAAAAVLQGCASMTSIKTQGNSVELDKGQSPTPLHEASGLRYSLPRGRLTIQVTAGFTYYAAMKKMKGALELSQLAPAVTGVVDDPDPNAQYFLRLNPSILSDDDFCISVNENGLLSSVGAVTADRSADIIKKVAETAAVFIGGPPAPGGAVILGAQSPARKNGVIVWDKTPFVEVTIDPYSPTEVAAAQVTIAKALRARSEKAQSDPSAALAATDKEIKAKNLIYEVNGALNSRINIVLNPPADDGRAVDGLQDPRALIAISTELPYGESSTPPRGEGVFYRVRRENAYTIEPAPGLMGRKQKAVASMPDSASTGLIAVNRGPMIRKETSLALSNGVLTSVHINKPSEALAVVSLPLDVAGAVIETPARFFSSIAAATRSDTALLSAKAELLQAEVEFLKAAKGEEAKVPQGAAFPAASPGIASPLKPPAAFSSGLTCSQG